MLVLWPLPHPRATVTDAQLSLHIFDDSCLSSVVWLNFYETASLAWNGVWSVGGLRRWAGGGWGTNGAPHRCLNTIIRLKYPSLNTRNCMRYYHIYVWASAVFFTALVVGTQSYGDIDHGGGWRLVALACETGSAPALAVTAPVYFLFPYQTTCTATSATRR